MNSRPEVADHPARILIVDDERANRITFPSSCSPAGAIEQLPHLEQTGLTVSVSYSMLAAVPRDVGASKENIVASMATGLEASVKSHILSEVDHE